MHNDKIGREKGAIKAMKTFALIIAFKEQLYLQEISQEKSYPLLLIAGRSESPY